jgi:phage-related baseplate assembly protein
MGGLMSIADEVMKFVQNSKTFDDLGKIHGLRRMILYEGHPDAVLVSGYWTNSTDDEWLESDTAFKRRIQEALDDAKDV